MQISLNRIDPNVLGQFRYNVIGDDSMILLRYDSEDKPNVVFKSQGENTRGDQYFSFTVGAEDRTINCIIQIHRTSKNCYIVLASDKKETKYRRLSTVSEISDFIKQNYCRTLLQGEKI